jgi:hypothetical protein
LILIILGLDISTSNVGWSLVASESSQKVSLIGAGGIHIGDIEGLYGKARATREALVKACAGHTIDAITIEEALMSFGKRRSSAGTLAILNRFNGMISFIARDAIGAPVSFVGSTTARKVVGLKINKDSEEDTKEQIFAWARKHPLMENYPWPTKVMKSGPRKGQTVYEPLCYDISDAFVTAVWGSKSLNTGSLNDTIC